MTKTATKARAAVEQARAALAQEESRLARARAALADVEGEVDAADPDGRGFSLLVSNRAAARARAEAIEERAERAASAVSQAEDAAAVAERDGKLAELREIDSQVAAAEGSITDLVLKFRLELAGLIKAQAARVARARTLARECDPHSARPASFWASLAAAPGEELHLATAHPRVADDVEHARAGARVAAA